RAEGRSAIYFREKVRQHIAGTKIDRLLSFFREDETKVYRRDETISIKLSCSNGTAPAHLGIGDISKPMRDVPAFVKLRNITRPSRSYYPLVDGTLQWQLISTLALNYLSLLDPIALRNILKSFDFPARADAQRERTARQIME